PGVLLCAGGSCEARIQRGFRIRSARRIGRPTDSAGQSWSGSGYPAYAIADSRRKPHQESFRFRTPPDGPSHSVLSYIGRSFPDTIWRIATGECRHRRLKVARQHRGLMTAVGEPTDLADPEVVG